MYCHLPCPLLCLLAFGTLRSAAALPSTPSDLFGWKSSLSKLLWPKLIEKRDSAIETNPNGSLFIWTLDGEPYEGQTFFDTFDFFTGSDPTNGLVQFVNSSTAFANGLAYVTENNEVIMRGDNTTTLPSGVNRDSVRISSKALYQTGLFILDLNKAPWGCAVWPAFWTVSNDNWPWGGEIDIIEGVHDNEHNQVTWHTGPGCNLSTPTSNFTGSIVQTNGVDNRDCNALINNNAGCGITEWSRASYGPYFDSQGGGVFAMKWDELGIAVWSFYRPTVPQDIIDGQPNPSTWGTPVAELNPTGCNPLQYFTNHSIVFDITFCGDWAGNSYATSNCPGTCAERLMDPSNFVNASWSINSLKVYKKQNLAGVISSAAESRFMLQSAWIFWVMILVGIGFLTL